MYVGLGAHVCDCKNLFFFFLFFFFKFYRCPLHIEKVWSRNVSVVND